MVTHAGANTNTITGPKYGEPRQMPWNVMGKHLAPTHRTNITKALKGAGMDYEVSLENVQAVTESGLVIPADKSRAVVRPTADGPKVIGMVGTRFTPIQNHDAFSIAQELTGDFGAEIDGLADFRHGGASIMSLKMPASMTLHTDDGQEDVTDMYLLVKNAQDGSGALSFMLTPVRVDCTNVLPFAAKSAKAVWKVSHTPNADERHSLARQAIRETLGLVAEMEVAAQAMVNTPMVDAEFAKIVAGMWAVKPDAEGKVAERRRAIQADVVALYKTSPTLDNVRGTRWGGYNALTEYLDHFRTVKGNGEKAQQIARAEGQIDGPNLRVKTNLFRQFAVTH